jgi:hypothetical protein
MTKKGPRVRAFWRKISIFKLTEGRKDSFVANAVGEAVGRRTAQIRQAESGLSISAKRGSQDLK